MDRIDPEILELHARVCRTLAHPVRLALLNALRTGEKGVGDLAEEVGVPQPTVSQHLGVLRNQGLLQNRRHGNEVFYHVAYPKMIQACDLLREVLFEHLRAQEQLILSGAAGRQQTNQGEEHSGMVQVKGFLGKDLEIPDDRRYDGGRHLWVLPQTDGEVLIGASGPGVALTGGLVELDIFPEAGDRLVPEEELAFATTRKNIKYFLAPLAGEVTAANGEATGELVNEQPYDTWLIRLRPEPNWEASLLTAQEYADKLAHSEHATEEAAKAGAGKGSPTCKSIYSGIKEA
ncbi:MAG: hypothetical protein Kow00129_14160 [Thermoleophilia bacterium]